MEIIGWDWLVIVSRDAINKQLAASQPLSRFDVSGRSGLLKQDVHLSGTFGKWSLQGGSGQTVHVAIPVATGSLEIKGLSPTRIDLAGAVFTVSLSLTFSATGSGPHVLNFKLDDASPEGQSPLAGQVGYLGLQAGKQRIDDGDARTAGFFLCKSLVENAAQVQFIFASILQPVAGSGWLVASHLSYALMTVAGSGHDYLCIGGLVAPARKVPGEVLMPPELVAGDPEAVVAMSQVMFFDKVIKPKVLPSPTFPSHVTSTSFSRRVDIKADKVVYSASYAATVSDHTFFGNVKVADIDGSVSETMGVSFDARSQRLGFVKDPKPSISHHEHQNTGGILLTGLLSVLGFGSLADLALSIAETCVVPQSFFAELAVFNSMGLGSVGLAHGQAFEARSASLNDVFFLTGVLS